MKKIWDEFHYDRSQYGEKANDTVMSEIVDLTDYGPGGRMLNLRLSLLS